MLVNVVIAKKQLGPCRRQTAVLSFYVFPIILIVVSWICYAFLDRYRAGVVVEAVAAHSDVEDLVSAIDGHFRATELAGAHGSAEVATSRVSKQYTAIYETLVFGGGRGTRSTGSSSMQGQ